MDGLWLVAAGLKAAGFVLALAGVMLIALQIGQQRGRGPLHRRLRDSGGPWRRRVGAPWRASPPAASWTPPRGPSPPASSARKRSFRPWNQPGGSIRPADFSD